MAPRLLTHAGLLRFSRWGYGILFLVGAIYQIVYVWPFWPVRQTLFISGVAVAFFYWFIGGYGFFRVMWAREEHDLAQSNRPLGAVIAVVALWDIASPFVFQDYHPVSVTFHVLGGLVALGLAALEMIEDPKLRKEARATRRPRTV